MAEWDVGGMFKTFFGRGSKSLVWGVCHICKYQ